MKSEFRQIEVFITEDGEEFTDEDSALEYEKYLNARQYFIDVVNCSEEDHAYVISKMEPYLKTFFK